VNEPFTNVLGNVYHYSIGQWNLFTTFDRPMPIWVVFAYVIFFGGITAMYEKLMEYGVSRARLWSAFVTVLAANLTFDLTAIHGGLYVLLRVPANVDLGFAGALVGLCQRNWTGDRRDLDVTLARLVRGQETAASSLAAGGHTGGVHWNDRPTRVQPPAGWA